VPPRKHPTIWKARPHTIAKIAILEDYLKKWFAVMGQTVRKPLVYIDGFAGPGRYTNHPTGSPIAALRAAQGSRGACGSRWIAQDTHCVFIEYERDVFDHLVEHLAPFNGQSGLHIHPFHDSFEDGLLAGAQREPLILADGIPRFAFIDPFGPTKASFARVRQLLASPLAEVLVNLDADGIGRILKAGDWSRHESLLTVIFGDESWRDELTATDDFRGLCRQVLALYRKKLLAIPRVEFVWSFEMAKKTDSIDYFLVFASRHPEGMRKMKESMKRIGQGDEYRFCDAAVGQEHIDLFSDADMDRASDQMREYFRGKHVAYRDLDLFALKETSYLNPKKMAMRLEKRGLIHVVAKDGVKRRPNGFKEEEIKVVRFDP